MEGVPAGGFPLPFQRRLSRLYNDTKKSSDFVTQPVQNAEDPDLKSLQRKLRIQKDRFVSWGLEWADPNQSAEIDDALSKAGLSEIVGSILSTIRDILAEAEPLWQSSKQGSGKAALAAPGDRKGPAVTWDKGKFEDLISDLTASVDTLYDLSRTRSSAALSSQPGRIKITKTSTSEDFKPFESSRIQTPQQIDPSSFKYLSSMQQESMISLSGFSQREIVFVQPSARSDIAQRIGSTAPLLLEFAPFDSIYSTTGITPPMDRFEKLSSSLQEDSRRSPGSWTGLPRLLGYFEDFEKSRLGLVYHFPAGFNAVSYGNYTQYPLNNLCTLSDLLTRPDYEPRLEAKFRLANNLASTVFDLHARGVTHGNIVDNNVSFCNAASTELTGVASSEVDVRRPLISSFDVFPDTSSEQQQSPHQYLYRHPLDPRTLPGGPISPKTDTRILDLYSLAMVLVSIGLWTKLENLVEPPTSQLPESILDQLAIRCGTLYMKAVQACWEAVDLELRGKSAGEELLAGVQVRAGRYLEACCIIDGVSGLDDRLAHDLGDSSIAQPQAETRGSSSKAAEASSSKSTVGRSPRTQRPETIPESAIPGTAAAKDSESTAPAKSSEKMRLYPQVPIPDDAVKQWNDVVMPRIDRALQSFYKKYRESVEISLESVGPSAQRTRPTVMVVCTSVSKVKAILTRKLGELFNGSSSTSFGLKVCRGEILRSRKQHSTPAKRSTAGNETERKALNPQWQERPVNGASIGAWIGDRHLPPVSLGGMLMVDGETYGMTVHHMLDDQEEMQSFAKPKEPELEPAYRSMAQPDDSGLRAFYAESSGYATSSDDYACQFSESDQFTETDITSDISDEGSESGEFEEAGDIPGIEPDLGDGYIITQPAMDDVEEGFYPSDDSADEEHLASFSFGEMYASSGIRRRRQDGLVHEVDWALFRFESGRRPNINQIPQAQSSGTLKAGSRLSQLEAADLCPVNVVPSSELPDLQVQCMARTSGLQVGKILPARASIKFAGRISPSHTWQVSSHVETESRAERGERYCPIGVPGDSGAWIVDREEGRLCGHILAWSERKQMAYICPIDVTLRDIAETVEAEDVRLPGGDALLEVADYGEGSFAGGDLGEEGDDEGDDSDTDPQLKRKSLPAQHQAKLSSASMDLAMRLEPMKLGGDDERWRN